MRSVVIGLIVGMMFAAPTVLAADMVKQSDLKTVTFVSAKLVSSVKGSRPTGLKFKSVAAVNQYVNGFKYIPDFEIYHVHNHWATTQEFFQHGGGDCKDFALVKRQLILENHLASAAEVKPLLVKVKKGKYKNEYHMVLWVQGWVLDIPDLNKRIVQSDAPEFKKHYRVLGEPVMG